MAELKKRCIDKYFTKRFGKHSIRFVLIFEQLKPRYVVIFFNNLKTATPDGDIMTCYKMLVFIIAPFTCMLIRLHWIMRLVVEVTGCTKLRYNLHKIVLCLQLYILTTNYFIDYLGKIG